MAEAIIREANSRLALPSLEGRQTPPARLEVRSFRRGHQPVCRPLQVPQATVWSPRLLELLFHPLALFVSLMTRHFTK